VAGVGMSSTRATHSDFGMTDRIVPTSSNFILSTNDITGLIDAKYSDDDDDDDDDDDNDDDDVDDNDNNENEDESKQCLASSCAVVLVM
jgi:hypothetical protein